MANIRLALRTLTKTPFVTAVAVFSLALGIGANAAIFSLFDQMLLQALPVEEPDRLVNLVAGGPNPGSQSCNQAGGCDEIFSHPMFLDLQEAETGLSGIAAHRLFGANLARAEQTVNGEGLLVSGSYFPVLGVRPVLGRLLGPADDQNVGANYVAVLSHHFWERNLGADPGVLNTTIVINGHAMTIVGVAAPGFEGTTLGSRPDVFVPITMRGEMVRGWEGFDNRRSYWAYLFGRLEEGRSIEQASLRVNAVYSAVLNDVEAELQQGMSEQTMERFRAKEITLAEGMRGQSTMHEEMSTPLKLLVGITAVVLLIACANIANLLLARGANRGQELAIRGSLGASRRQLLVQLLTESTLLAALGGAASLVVAHWTLRIAATVLPPDAVDNLTLALQPSVVLSAGILAIGTGFLFGLYPALHSTRSDLITVIKAGSGQPSGARAAARFRTALVTAQIALSMALLVGAGLFIKSLANVSRVDLGLDADNLVTFGLSPVLNGYEPEQTLAFFERVEQEIAALPGVTNVSASLVAILSGSNWGNDVNVEGWERGPDIDSNSRLNRIGAGYFRTLGVPLLAGREFTASDGAGAPQVAIVNEAFTKKFNLDGAAAVGKWMSTGSEELDLQIVGVVQDARYAAVKQEVPPLFFVPYRQVEGTGSVTFYVRTLTDPRELMRAVPGVVRRLDANLPVEDLKTLRQQISENVVLDRLISSLSAAFATLATLLAAVGLYGVLAYTVTQRTREIGLRMALGADGGRVRTMVLQQVGRMTLVGCLVGIGGALALGRTARTLLYGLEGHDPVVVVSVTALLAAVALGAGYLPALRASRVDPMRALRYE